jgi:hypothetical protein
MTPEEYLAEIKSRLAEDIFVAQYAITREQFTPLNAHIRVRLTFTDNSSLEFSEFIRVNNQQEIDIVTYSFHWMNEESLLITRWDNAEHYPNLEFYPHHIHDGDETNVLPGEPMNLFKVLDLIAARLKK